MDANQFEVTPKEAVQIQKELRAQVRLAPLTHAPKLIGGCDVSMNRFATRGFAGFVTLSFPELAEVGHAVIEDEIPFPYVPGLLSFREIPMFVKAWEKLKQKPDVLFVDGVGIAHPRRLGIATHLGLVLGIPTIGCGKSILYGVCKEPSQEAGSFSDLVDPKTGELLGVALRTKRNVAPMYISPGHLITVTEAKDLVMSCVRKRRLPEPTRFAHRTVNGYRIAAQ